MSHVFGVTTHGYAHPLAAVTCPQTLSEYHARNAEPNPYAACDLGGRTAAAFPDRDLGRTDVLYGGADGYSYGSNKRTSLMRRRSLPPAETPRDAYRLPPLTNMQYHWFFGDPELASERDTEATRNPLGHCEVAKRSRPSARVAGLTNKEVDRVIRLQERGLARRAGGGMDSQGPPGSVIRQGTVRPGDRTERPSGSPGSEGSDDAAGQTPGQRAPPEPEVTAGEEVQSVVPPAAPREVCKGRVAPRLWYNHRRRYPQFYSAMTRFVETVRINDKLFEMY